MQGSVKPAQHAKLAVALTRTPRTKWVQAGLEALASGGPDAVRIELLAQALGVSRGGFYWQFEGRREFLDELLATWERMVIDEVIDSVEADGGDGRDKLARLFALGRSVPELINIEVAIREWARRDKPVARRLRRVDNRRMEYMRRLFGAFCADDAEVEVRCLLAFSLFMGSVLIACDHGERGRGEVVDLAMGYLLR